MNSTFLKVLVILLVSPFMAYDGIYRGIEYGAIDERLGQSMVVTSVNKPSGRTVFPDYQATGFLLSSGQRVNVGIFKREYQSLRPGDRLVVFVLPSKPHNFITASKLDESKPFIRVGMLVVSWHFMVAVFFLGLGAIFSYRSRQKSRQHATT